MCWVKAVNVAFANFSKTYCFSCLMNSCCSSSSYWAASCKNLENLYSNFLSSFLFSFVCVEMGLLNWLSPSMDSVGIDCSVAPTLLSEKNAEDEASTKEPSLASEDSALSFENTERPPVVPLLSFFSMIVVEGSTLTTGGVFAWPVKEPVRRSSRAVLGCPNWASTFHAVNLSFLRISLAIYKGVLAEESICFWTGFKLSFLT